MLHIHPELRTEICKPDDIKHYVYAGKSVVTLQSPTNVSHTYYFKRPDISAGFPPDVLFVYVIHEGQTLFYLGMIEQGKFRVTKASRFLPDTPVVIGVHRILKMCSFYDYQMKLYHEGTCGRCGRKLTGATSRERGIGPSCFKKLYGNKTSKSIK